MALLEWMMKGFLFTIHRPFELWSAPIPIRSKHVGGLEFMSFPKRRQQQVLIYTIIISSISQILLFQAKFAKCFPLPKTFPGLSFPFTAPS